VASDTTERSAVYRSLVPARMDRLPWTRFHWLVVVSLGITWILDGLEIQIASAIGSQLQKSGTLGLSSSEVGASASVYLAGEVFGALLFGRLSDRLGRRKLFIFTLGLYLVANGVTGFSVNIVMFFALRFIAGMGIGGEYAAINSAIDELIPADYRGRVDIAINGTYWAGAAIGAAAEIFFLNPNLFGENVGWRLGFFIGPVVGMAIWGLRRHLPESPRWLMTHGHEQEAERTVDEIEERVRAEGVELAPVDPSRAIEVRPQEQVTYRQIARVMLAQYRSRSVLGFTMMVTQAFLYNAIFFTYSLVLTHFYGVSSSSVPYFFFPFAVGNLLGPLTIGHLFDTVGRRKMIAGTYCVSAVLLAISGWLFHAGLLNAVTQTVVWCVIFFLASAGASSAYLTVSEIFPLELRAQAISFFFAISQLVGGVLAPTIFGALIGSGKDRTPLLYGYLFGAVLMFVGGAVAWWIGVDAERRSLEDIANPLSAVTRGISPTGSAPA
jgi:MFS family permease